MVCFRYTDVNTLHKGDEDDDDDNNNNKPRTTSSEMFATKSFGVDNLFPFQTGCCAVRTHCTVRAADMVHQRQHAHILPKNRTTQLLSSVCFEFFPFCLLLYSYTFFLSSSFPSSSNTLTYYTDICAKVELRTSLFLRYAVHSQVNANYFNLNYRQASERIAMECLGFLPVLNFRCMNRYFHGTFHS